MFLQQGHLMSLIVSFIRNTVSFNVIGIFINQIAQHRPDCAEATVAQA